MATSMKSSEEKKLREIEKKKLIPSTTKEAMKVLQYFDQKYRLSN